MALVGYQISVSEIYNEISDMNEVLSTDIGGCKIICKKKKRSRTKHRLRFFSYLEFLILNIAIVINVKAMKASSGIVMKPSQFIYCPEQGTPLEQT